MSVWFNGSISKILMAHDMELPYILTKLYNMILHGGNNVELCWGKQYTGMNKSFKVTSLEVTKQTQIN